MTAAYAGLLASSIAALIPASIDLESNPPNVVAQAVGSMTTLASTYRLCHTTRGVNAVGPAPMTCEWLFRNDDLEALDWLELVNINDRGDVLVAVGRYRGDAVGTSNYLSGIITRGEQANRRKLLTENEKA